MKYDVTKPVLDNKGVQFKDTEPVTMGIIMERVLLADQPPTRPPLDTAVKAQRFKLWRKVSHATGELELTVDEANCLKDAAHILSTLFYGQFVEYLDSGA